ncbi:Beta-galactosidase [Sulfitobacter noctilucicola]|uniref:Beta-galactosidase n=1 Tax=Sulfitobacter noctilucicola TaxID=1342301 RepID=A0A7W6Q765_9RHOB|nr:beta-galactosidase [Sulfitobacter noctilucicola]KIN66228.1 Beta-galactosidase [Sulfitobacter noctilucicola]MBB4175582.1 beta-galactosidase [Sulfitobacter noctilucicola]
MKRSLGVCYYPEHWPQEMWALDAQRMADVGITWVRIGEFAWSRLEPQQGVYDFDWLDAAIAVLADAGLKVVLGTPSATPPRWMLERFPDMLAVDAGGQPRKFGSRRHYCHSHAGYRKAAADMAAMMGKRYGRDPRVTAWQIDNEYGCHETVLSYSDAARHAFRDWLAQRYQSVDALNRAWGNVFWSMEYADFDEVDLPNLTVTQPNPAHELAFRRFASDQVASWNAAQVTALRPLTDAPLIHNYMGRVLEFDHFAVARDLDIASWDSYPIGFLSDRLEGDAAHKARYLQQGDPDMQAFHHDLYRAMNNGRWWVMEQQPGPVNWAPYNPAPLPGMVRLWSWEAFAHGAEVVSYFRWRQAPFAQEQMHAGLLRPDDVAAQGLSEAAQVALELEQMPDVAQKVAPVALIFDYASDWAWQTLPQGADFDYFRLVFDCYRALRRQGLSVDILSPDTDAEALSGYNALFAPGLAHIPQTLMDALSKANVPCLIGPRSNLMTEELSTALPLGPGIPDLDTSVVKVESLPPNITRQIEGGGAIVHWVETLEGAAQALMHGKDGAAVLTAAGPLHYLGGWPDTVLWDRLVSLICTNLTLTALPDGLRLRDTATHRFAFNYAPETTLWEGREIEAAGVAWWPLPSDKA